MESIDRITEYPDIKNQYEKDLLRDHHGNHDLEILLSNGAVGLFYELAQILKPKRLLILSPTFMVVSYTHLCPPCYSSSRPSDPLVFSRWEEYGCIAPVYPNELDSPDCGGCLFSGVEGSQLLG